MEPGTKEKANSDIFPCPTSLRGWWVVLGPSSHMDHILKITDLVHSSPFYKWGIIKKVIDRYTNAPNTQTPQTLFFFFFLFLWLYWGLVAAHGLFNAECRIFSYGLWTLSCGKRDLVPWPGIKPGPLHWEHGVLATGPPEKFPHKLFYVRKIIFRIKKESRVGKYLQCMQKAKDEYLQYVKINSISSADRKTGKRHEQVT